jgi:MFS family permease
MLVAGIDPLFMFIAHLYFGRRMISFGIKRTMLLGTLVTILSFTSFLLASTWILTIFGWVCIGFAYGAFHNASVTFVSLYFPPARRGEGIGYVWTANTLGIMLGPVIAGATAEISYSLMLLTMIAFSAVGLLVLWFFVAKDDAAVGEEPGEEPGPVSGADSGEEPVAEPGRGSEQPPE